MFLKQRKWTRKCIAWVMLIQFILQPALVAAEAVPDASADSQNKPTVATQNGVPVILITAPSAAGISRNIFTTFNIDSQGLIFNNSQTATITQLAGSISGNANLTGGMARIILTEVTGSSSSQLNGYLEVAGQRADVIIANPNGIVCSGLGFINTGRGV
ncbi:MAG: adhesin HecA family repeat protein, partial [Firmicutes bacterium]|nr:adhesin HecA family repeat protein [Bacillota bacterium]